MAFWFIGGEAGSGGQVGDEAVRWHEDVIVAGKKGLRE
jgi:hypothetical protein